MNRSECTVSELREIGYFAMKRITTLSGSWIERCSEEQSQMVFEMVVQTVQKKGKMQLRRGENFVEVHSEEWKQSYSVLNVEYFICRRLNDETIR